MVKGLLDGKTFIKSPTLRRTEQDRKKVRKGGDKKKKKNQKNHQSAPWQTEKNETKTPH